MLHAHSVFSTETDSLQAGRHAGENLARPFAGDRIEAVLVYATINPEQSQVLQGLRAALGREVPVLGGSAQGVVADDQLTEGGFALGAMAFGGSGLHAAVSVAHELQSETLDKGRALARGLARHRAREPTGGGIV